MCAICQLIAVGFAQLDGQEYFATLVRLATLAKSEGHSRFHRRMNRRAKLGINMELLSQITFLKDTAAGLEISKIVPPVPEGRRETDDA
jgi:hypothetical protein